MNRSCLNNSLRQTSLLGRQSCRFYMCELFLAKGLCWGLDGACPCPWCQDVYKHYVNIWTGWDGRTRILTCLLRTQESLGQSSPSTICCCPDATYLSRFAKTRNGWLISFMIPKYNSFFPLMRNVPQGTCRVVPMDGWAYPNVSKSTLHAALQRNWIQKSSFMLGFTPQNSYDIPRRPIPPNAPELSQF